MVSLDADPQKSDRRQRHQRTDPEQNGDPRIERNRTKIARYLPKERSQRKSSQPHTKGDPPQKQQLKPRSFPVGVNPIRSNYANAGMPVNAKQRYRKNPDESATPCATREQSMLVWVQQARRSAQQNPCTSVHPSSLGSSMGPIEDDVR